MACGREMVMPWWQPDWDDVQFDHAAAQAALDACRSTLADVEHAGHWSAGPMVVHLDWRGRFRDAFDERLGSVEQHLGRSALELAGFAATLEGAIVTAREEQAHREIMRDVWHAERARELALADGS